MTVGRGELFQGLAIGGGTMGAVRAFAPIPLQVWGHCPHTKIIVNFRSVV